MPEAVLISIHPEYADAILSGKKKVEFRKVRFKRAVNKLVIYVTSPISAIVAVVDIAGFVEGSPTTVWASCASRGAIGKDDFFDYFAGSETAVGIELENVIRLTCSLALNDILPGSKPPQSFRYISRELVQQALASV